MRNTSLAKWWPFAAIAVVGLTVMTAALVPLRPHVAIRLIHPIAVKMTCALTPAALAADDSTDTQGDSTGSYDYDFSGDKNDVVRMGEDIEIGADQTVHGDVVAIGGRATIYGHVRGDVVSIGGGIHLMSGCVVDGDAVVVGGVMDREEGATVHGQNVSVAGFPKAFGRWWMPRVGHHYRADVGRVLLALRRARYAPLHRLLRGRLDSLPRASAEEGHRPLDAAFAILDEPARRLRLDDRTHGRARSALHHLHRDRGRRSRLLCLPGRDRRGGRGRFLAARRSDRAPGVQGKEPPGSGRSRWAFCRSSCST